MKGCITGVMTKLAAGIACLAFLAVANRESAAQGGIPEGFMVIEGDIIVPEDYYTRGTYATNLWPNGVVPYSFDPNVTEANQDSMLLAMEVWEDVANVDFRPLDGDPRFIHIRDSTGNNSHVGMMSFPQIVNIFNWNERFIMAHELGHALGFWHEQSRADRDDSVVIRWDHIEPGQEHNFEIREDRGPMGSGEYGPYDFDSVMHYGACDFTSCGCPPACPCTPDCRTIEILPPNQNQVIGQNDHLSTFDRMTMSFLYPQGNWRFVDVTASGNQTGSFFEPYHQFAPGYGNTPIGGTLWVQPGSYLAGGIHNRAMTIKAPLGSVTLGN